MKNLKTIILLLTILMSLHATAHGKKVRGNGNVISETRTTSDYEKITISGSFDVTLVDGKEGKLTIKIEDNLSQYLVTEVKDGTLKIKWQKGINIKTKKGVTITIPFEQINAITLAGSSNVNSQKNIISHQLELIVAGSGNINAIVKTTNLITKIAGSGNVDLSGNTSKLNCKIAGSGNFDSYDLTIQNLEAKIAGSGTLKATINGKISAKIAGSGNLYYKGTATRENVKIAGSGSVIRK